MRVSVTTLLKPSLLRGFLNHVLICPVVGFLNHCIFEALP
ncbi:hypothetical protein OUI_0587 [Helicobacter pylori R036d]|uniref:Uncharacterized protein n=1 Tax=Helicobacter pylori R036d TaxID=1145113 RepID=K2KC38_HELPX|nr:hypothetical protein OUI_0587 [Helicobacter pylori R036d]